MFCAPLESRGSFTLELCTDVLGDSSTLRYKYFFISLVNVHPKLEYHTSRLTRVESL